MKNKTSGDLVFNCTAREPYGGPAFWRFVAMLATPGRVAALDVRHDEDATGTLCPNCGERLS